jgi:predicted enzyme related to lactoylglutathione lyase
MIQGLRTAIYAVTDLEKGKAWYTKVLGKPPYYDQPYYVGYSVGGFELGLIPDGKPGEQGVHVYWGVADVAAEAKRLEAMRAEMHSPIKDVGEGIKVASFLDPFGNVFGIIENPTFDPKAMR